MPKEIPQITVLLANLAREDGEQLEPNPQNEDDMSDRWAFKIPSGPFADRFFIFHAEDEMTNRLYVGFPQDHYRSEHLDMRENTFKGVSFSKGGESDLRNLYAALEEKAAEVESRLERNKKQQAQEGLSVVDGMGYGRQIPGQ